MIRSDGVFSPRRGILVGLAACLVLGVLPGVAGVNQWTSAGPEGAFANRIVFDPSSASRVFVGTSSNGVFRSTDSGATWTAANQDLEGVRDLVVANDGTLYGIDTLTNSPSVYRSSDAGATWDVTSAGLGTSRVESIGVEPGDSSQVLVGTSSDGIFKSTNSGASFVASNTGLPTPLRTISRIVFHPSGSRIYLGIRSRGVHKSVDGGVTWTASNVGIETKSIVDIAIDPSTPDTMFASTFSEIFKSTDGGMNWGTALPAPNSATASIAIDPSTPSTLFVGGSTLAKSIDGGASWSPIDFGVPTFANDVAVDPNNSQNVATATGFGIVRSSDGGTGWGQANSGLMNFYVVDIEIDSVTPSILYTQADSGVFKSTTAGAVWIDSNQGFMSRVLDMDIAQSNPNTLYAIGDDEVYRSTNGGAAWQPRIGDLGQFGSFPALFSVAVDPTDPDIVYVCQFIFFFTGNPVDPIVLKSIDGGVNWQQSYVPDMTNINSFNARPNHIVIDPLDPDRIYVAYGAVATSSMAGTTIETRVIRSENGGGTWEIVHSIPDRTESRALAIDPQNPNNLYVGAAAPSTGLEWMMDKSTNGGDSWVPVDTSTTNNCGGAIAIDPGDSNTIYLGCLDLYVSSDAGANWEMFDNSGLPPMGRFTMRALGIVPPQNGERSSTAGGLPVPPQGTTIHTSTRAGLYSYTVDTLIFSDGFESGDLAGWSGSVP